MNDYLLLSLEASDDVVTGLVETVEQGCVNSFLIISAGWNDAA